MKARKSNLIVLLGIASSFAISSCSEKQDMQPSTQVMESKSDHQVVNGRLVFADQKAFERTISNLEGILAGKSSAEKLDAWESNLNFVSLRKSSLKESSHLEELDLQGREAPSYELMSKFGFPTDYATIINPKGEYQIGSKIYWFDNGFKYEVSSDEELVLIKADPSLANIKYQAGSKFVELNNKNTKAQTQNYDLTYANNNPYCDDKYVTPTFFYKGDSGSKRRIIYGISVYTEDLGYNPGPIIQRSFNTALILRIKYEYLSGRKNKWYPQQNEPFTWAVNFTASGGPSVPYPAPGGSSGMPLGYQNQSETYSNGLKDIVLGRSYVVGLATGIVDTFPNDVTWTFTINGSITGYPTQDIANKYTVNGNDIW
ncbi:hypothetical protein [Hymenobacter actinosclerus]|uniref:DUF4848 domain-containing protein n=1 Tax=Hymenobacter actinosclerus TaxID=82805 RepID=A0A1I0IKL5_9BACT|nr:hypothetical protein [Hymenobacter actinosclerus]SET96918.1 hypothetical protein SAMN04487998_3323 [Hymenobacter actinosclerus]